MERLFLECTVRVFLLISATAILLHVMRVKDAAAKHRVWTGVMPLMLLLPVWATWGPKVSLRVLPPLPRAMSHGPIVTEGSLQAPVAQKLSSGELLLVSVYLVGFCVLVLRLAVGTIHTRRLIRYAVLQDGVRTSPLCASPVTGRIFLPDGDFSGELAGMGTIEAEFYLGARGGTRAPSRFAITVVCVAEPHRLLVPSGRVVVGAHTIWSGGGGLR